MPKVRPLKDNSSAAEKTAWLDGHAREHERISSILASFLGSVTNNTFTGTLTGMTATTNGTVNYIVVSQVATIYVAADITGTSNSTSMTMTGLPSILQPLNLVAPFCGNMEDNGVTASLGQATIPAGGSTITFSKMSGVVTSSTGFTNSGIKGLNAGWIITYPIK